MISYRPAPSPRGFLLVDQSSPRTQKEPGRRGGKITPPPSSAQGFRFSVVSQLDENPGRWPRTHLTNFSKTLPSPSSSSSRRMYSCCGSMVHVRTCMFFFLQAHTLSQSLSDTGHLKYVNANNVEPIVGRNTQQKKSKRFNCIGSPYYLVIGSLYRIHKAIRSLWPMRWLNSWY